MTVYGNSPAETASLRAHTDYIIGSPFALLKEKEDLFTLVESFMNKPLHLYVYNWETDRCREISIVPDREWGGTGSLGCDIGFGAQHQIPRKKFTAKDARILTESVTALNNSSSLTTADSISGNSSPVGSPVKKLGSLSTSPTRQQQQQPVYKLDQEPVENEEEEHQTVHVVLTGK